MDRLLHEMERGGVDFDAETVRIIERVREEKAEDEAAEIAAVDEVERKKAAVRQLRGVNKKARQKMLRKKGLQGGEPDGASAGKRARAWWEAQVTARWFERITATGGWRGKVMERLRERSIGGMEAVVEREYAGSIVGGEDEVEGKVML